MTLRLAIYSNSPHAPTGYGTQTKMLLSRLTADGIQPCVLGQWGNQTRMDAFPTEHGMVPIWPMGSHHYGLDVVTEQARAWFGDGDGWVLTLYDVWVMQNAFKGMRVASWTPVDHNPVTPAVARWASEHRTIAMSRFGMKALADAGVKSVYIPHALEKVFAPTESDVRERLSLPDDAFLVMMNAANIKPPHLDRKAFQQNLRAFAVFQRAHPDAYLYLHTDPTRQGGFSIASFMKFVGIPETSIRIPPMLEYRAGLIGEDELARLYTATDVLLACSMGEGFGIPVAEAMACGTPAIVTDFTAQPEIVGDTGWLVDCEPYYDEPQRSDFAIPSIVSIIEALEAAYEERGSKRALERSAAAEQRARAEYDADTVYAERWRPYLAELEVDLIPKIENRAARRHPKRAA